MKIHMLMIVSVLILSSVLTDATLSTPLQNFHIFFIFVPDRKTT
jgi:hypothetical protein